MLGKGLLKVLADKFELDFDDEAKKIGLMVGIPNEIYTCSISRYSNLYIEFVKNKWVAWRETYVPNKDKCKSYKVIAHGSFELVMIRTKSYLRFINKNRGGQ